MTEIQFWEAKCMNLESLFEQVHYIYFAIFVKSHDGKLQMKANTTRKMASILNVTESAYYPAFKYRLTIVKAEFIIFIFQVHVQECCGSSQ